MHRFLPIAVTACALLWSAAATAQPALYDGERLIREGRYKDALGLLLPAYMNDPTAELAYAIARAYDGSRDDPRALKFYQSSLAQRGLSRKGRKHAKRRIRSIKSRLKNRPRKATLSLKSSAPGALVRVNGAEIGRTPLSGVLIPPGRHVVTVTHDAWETWEKQVNVAPFDQVHLDAEMVDRPTDVLVHTEPAGANAIMANGQRCVTPCLFSLRGGNYKLTVTRDGYRPLVHDFVKPPGQLLELRLRLVPLGAGPVTMRGYLQVNVDRPGANILVDGQAVARSPTAQPLAVVPGTHRVSVALQGFQPWVGDVQIAPAQTTTIAVQLVPTGAVTPVRNPPTQPIAVNVPVRQPDPVRPTPIGATGPGGGEPDTALGWGTRRT